MNIERSLALKKALEVNPNLAKSHFFMATAIKCKVKEQVLCETG